MAPYSSNIGAFVSRHARVLALTTITMLGSAYLLVIGAPGQPIQVWKDSSGTEVCRITSGGLLVGDCTTGLGSSGGTNVNTGAILDAGNSRFVNVSGDTMTGGLTVNVFGGDINTIGINGINTISGGLLSAAGVFKAGHIGSEYGMRTVAASGELMTTLGNDSSFNGLAIYDNASNENIVLRTQLSNASAFFAMYQPVSQNDAYTVNVYDTEGTQQVIKLSAAQSVLPFIIENSAGLDIATFGTNGALTLNQGSQDVDTRFKSDNNENMFFLDASTDRIGIGTNEPDTTLEVIGAVSGVLLRAQSTLASSGTLVWEGAASGASLWVSAFDGAGLTDCDLSTSTLTWDATLKRFGCGTDSDTTYTAGQGLTLTATSLKTNTTLTGSMLRFLTVSGSVLYAKTSLSSSGSLTWEGQGSGAALYVGGTFEGAGLTDCDADNQTLSWDATSKRFGCGDDDTGVGGGLSMADGDARYVNTSGDTMTGKLTINLSSGTLGLNVLQTISGADLKINGAANFSMDSALVIERRNGTDIATIGPNGGNNSFTIYSPNGNLSLDLSSGASDTSVLDLYGGSSGNQGFEMYADSTDSLLTLYDPATSAQYFRLWTEAARNSFQMRARKNQTADLVQIGSGALGSFSSSYFMLSAAGNVAIGKPTATAKLDVAGTISGSVITTNTLRSSGSLVFEGAGSGNSLYIAGTASIGALTARNLLSCPFVVTNGSGVASCGTLPTRTIVLTAGGGLPAGLTGSGASGPERFSTSALNQSEMYVLEYGNFAKARYATWTATMPDNYDGGTMTFKFNWKTAATSGDVKYYIQCRSLGDNEAIDQSWGTAVGIADTAATTNTLRTTSSTAAVTCAGTPAGGEVIQFRVYRDAADAADTLADTGALISVKGEYVTNALSD